MSTLKVNKITPQGVATEVTLGDSGDTFTIPSGVTLTNNGSASGFGGDVGNVEVWVNFDGRDTVAINDSGNVSSITDNGVGIYTVNFTTNLANANYSAITNIGNPNSVNINGGTTVHTLAVGSFVIRTRNQADNIQIDPKVVTGAVIM